MTERTVAVETDSDLSVVAARLDPVSPRRCITVFADASFDMASRRAAIAGWFRGNDPKSTRRCSRLLTFRVESNTEAETFAICITILTALRHIPSGLGDFVVAKSDCEHALRVLEGTAGNEREREFAQRVRQRIRELGLDFYPRHVKGHSSSDAPRHWVNNWCDREARRLLRGK